MISGPPRGHTGRHARSIIIAYRRGEKAEGLVGVHMDIPARPLTHRQAARQGHGHGWGCQAGRLPHPSPTTPVTSQVFETATGSYASKNMQPELQATKVRQGQAGMSEQRQLCPARSSWALAPNPSESTVLAPNCLSHASEVL